MSEEQNEYTTGDLRDTAAHIRRDLHSGRVPLNVSLGDAIDLLVIVTERLNAVVERLSELTSKANGEDVEAITEALKQKVRPNRGQQRQQHQ